MSDVRSAIPDAEAYYSDHDNYTAMTARGLQTAYDSGLTGRRRQRCYAGISKAKVGSGGAQTYCISAVVSGHWAYVAGPGGQVPNGDSTCPVTVG